MSVVSDFIATSDDGTSGRVVMSLVGELDLTGAFTLSEATASLLEAVPPWLVFDLSGITFIDSSGLQALLTSQQQASDRGATVTIRRVPIFVRRVFDVTDAWSKFLVEEG